MAQAKTTYTAEGTINGETMIRTRTSHRIYTHAAFRGPYSDGTYGVTFHGSAAQAARKNEYGPSALVVEVLSDRAYNDAAKAAMNKIPTVPAAVEPAPEDGPAAETQEFETAAPVEPQAWVSKSGAVHTRECRTVKAHRFTLQPLSLADAWVRINGGTEHCSHCAKVERDFQAAGLPTSQPTPAVPVEHETPISETTVEESRHAPVTHVVTVDGVERVKASRGKPEANELFDILVRENPESVVIMTTVKGREVRRHDGPLGEQQAADTTPSAEVVAEHTGDVIRALHKLTGRDAWTELWESLPSGSVEEFRKAGDRSLLGSDDVRRRTLDGADWREVFEHFHPTPERTEAEPVATVDVGDSKATVDVEETGVVTFASDAELGATLPQAVMALAALVEQGRTVRILSGPLAGQEDVLLAAAPLLAQLHRDRTSERVSAGLAAAKARGRTAGRPKALDDATRAALVARVDGGESIPEAARALNISRATAYRALPKAK